MKPGRAMLPVNGWNWNPAESGRGFNIEIQDNALFMAAFLYRLEAARLEQGLGSLPPVPEVSP